MELDLGSADMLADVLASSREGFDVLRLQMAERDKPMTENLFLCSCVRGGPSDLVIMFAQCRRGADLERVEPHALEAQMVENDRTTNKP
eukprot:8221700-Pyramimonas_sp.AAC.1